MSEEQDTKKAYFSTKMPTDVSHYERLKDGGLLIHDVLIMAEGVWTSSEGIKARFTPEILKKCAKNWKDNTLWAKHPGGMPRNVVTDTLGAAINPRYDEKAKSWGEDGKVTEIPAVVADLLVHGKTGSSEGAITLFQLPEEQGGIRSVSAETVLTFDKKTEELVDMLYTGVAAVRQGACEACRMPAYEAAGDGKMATTEPKKEGASGSPQGSPGGATDMPEWAKTFVSDVEARLSKIEKKSRLEEEEEEEEEEAKEDDEDDEDEDDEGKKTEKKSAYKKKSKMGKKASHSEDLEVELAETKEDLRKLKAAFEKATEKPSGNFSAQAGGEEGQLNSKGKPAVSVYMDGGRLMRN